MGAREPIEWLASLVAFYGVMRRRVCARLGGIGAFRYTLSRCELAAMGAMR